MAKFDKCILHIGITKTGTTSLQEFFSTNRSVLAKKGILYPITFGEINHRKLAYYTLDFPEPDHVKKKFGILPGKFIKAGLTSKDRVEDFRKEILSSFQKEIQNTNCTKLLISTEGFTNLSKVENIHTLKKFLDDFVNEYTIIVYLRSQHERITSSLTTKCISGTRTRSDILKEFREPLSKRVLKNYNYERLLADWTNVFGDENVIPRIFSRKDLLGGDVKKDFVSLLGWNWNDFEDIENRNEGISVDAQRFMLQMNKVLPRFIGNKVNENRGNVGQLVQGNFKGKGFRPTRQIAENFFKIYEDSNEKVRQKWFPVKKELFEVDFDKYPEKEESFEVDLEKDYTFAFEVFAKLLLEKQEKINHLREKLKDEGYLQEQISTQQSEFDQLNREQNEKVSEKDYTFAFEVFAKLWAEKIKENRHLREKLKEKNDLIKI